MNITTDRIAIALALALLPSTTFAAGKAIPRDALVLEKPVEVRQFPDRKGKVVAKLRPCDELVLIEKGGKKRGYVEAIFLNEEAQKVKRGWVKWDDSLYVFPEPRPALPRTDTTPAIAFPWDQKAPQPGDPDYARVTRKSFLFTCLEHPHPEKVRAILKQILDRYTADLTAEDVVKILPLLRYTEDADLPRVKDLLAKFKTNPDVAKFLAANPIFGPTIEEKEIAASTPIPHPTETPAPNPVGGLLMGLPIQKIAMGVIGGAAIVLILSLLMRSRRKKRESAHYEETQSGPDGPAI